MKYLLLFVSALCFAFVSFAQQVSVTPNKFRGMPLYVECVPVKPYTVLGTVRNGFFFGSSYYRGIRRGLVRRANKRYHAADGLIMYPERRFAEVIKFK